MTMPLRIAVALMFFQAAIMAFTITTCCVSMSRKRDIDRMDPGPERNAAVLTFLAHLRVIKASCLVGMAVGVASFAFATAALMESVYSAVFLP